MAQSSKDKPHAGRFSYEGLDRVIHERARLSILTSLIANKRGLLFGDLKRLCALSDGNLSRHLQVLVEAKLVAVAKGFEKNRPQTICRITALGRTRYLEYVEVLEQVVRDAATGMSEQLRAVAQRLAPA
jgi:DNA-binding HxlR family transcriptional regulator